MTTGNGERGSILLFALFVCLAIAVLVQTLTVVVICADRATEAEDTGRGLMREHDEALSSVRQELLTNWAPRGLSWVGEGSAQVSTQVSEVPESAGWVLDASVAHAETVSPIGVSAWVERGRDGLDLPLAGLVAQSAAWAGERATPVMEMDGVPSGVAQAGSSADGLAEWLVAEPGAPPLGVGLTAGVLRAPWKLDDGWRRFLEEREGEQAGAEGVVPTADVVVIHGPTGDTVTLPGGWGVTAGRPELLVLTGGASLDARGRADLYGVVVVDGGGVLLEGTRLHGALFATGTVDLGSNGEVLFSRSTLRWATDRSLVRSRLVPGSRRETIR